MQQSQRWWGEVCVSPNANVSFLQLWLLPIISIIWLLNEWLRSSLYSGQRRGEDKLREWETTCRCELQWTLTTLSRPRSGKTSPSWIPLPYSHCRSDCRVWAVLCYCERRRTSCLEGHVPAVSLAHGPAAQSCQWTNNNTQFPVRKICEALEGMANLGGLQWEPQITWK